MATFKSRACLWDVFTRWAEGWQKMEFLGALSPLLNGTEGSREGRDLGVIR